jgi:hypothetical protein
MPDSLAVDDWILDADPVAAAGAGASGAAIGEPAATGGT